MAHHSTLLLSKATSLRSMFNTRHPLHRYVSYSCLSPQYQCFLAHISPLVEHATYEQACQNPHLVEPPTRSLPFKPNSKLSQTTIPRVLFLFHVDNNLSATNGCSSLSIDLMGLLNATKLALLQKVSPNTKALTTKRPSPQ